MLYEVITFGGMYTDDEIGVEANNNFAPDPIEYISADQIYEIQSIIENSYNFV